MASNYTLASIANEGIRDGAQATATRGLWWNATDQPQPEEASPEMAEAIGKWRPGKMYQTADREEMAKKRAKYVATNRAFRLASLGG